MSDKKSKDTNDDPVDPEDVKESELVSELLKRSFERYSTIIKNDQRDYNDDINALQTVVTEFLDEFIIIGYTPDNRRVILRYAPTPKGYDGLKELARIFLMKMIVESSLSEDG